MLAAAAELEALGLGAESGLALQPESSATPQTKAEPNHHQGLCSECTTTRELDLITDRQLADVLAESKIDASRDSTLPAQRRQRLAEIGGAPSGTALHSVRSIAGVA